MSFVTFFQLILWHRSLLLIVSKTVYRTSTYTSLLISVIIIWRSIQNLRIFEHPFQKHLSYIQLSSNQTTDMIIPLAVHLTCVFGVACHIEALPFIEKQSFSIKSNCSDNRSSVVQRLYELKHCSRLEARTQHITV